MAIKVLKNMFKYNTNKYKVNQKRCDLKIVFGKFIDNLTELCGK